jgi:ABC-type multidrug transport system fused ATPase/permease subunit
MSIYESYSKTIPIANTLSSGKPYSYVRIFLIKNYKGKKQADKTFFIFCLIEFFMTNSRKRPEVLETIVRFIKPFFWRGLSLSFFYLSYLAIGSILMSKIIAEFVSKAPLFGTVTLNLNTFIDPKKPYLWGFLLCFIRFVESFVCNIASWLSSKLYPYLQYSVRIYFFNKSQNFPLSYFQSKGAGYIENFISAAAEAISDISLIFFEDILPCLLFIIFGIVHFALKCSIYIAIINLIWITLHVTLYFHLSKRASHLSKVRAEFGHQRTDKAIECLQNILTVKTFDLYNYCTGKVKEIHDKESDFAKKYIRRNAINIVVTNLLLLFVQLIVIVYWLPSSLISFENLSQIVNFNFWFTHTVNSTSKELVGIIEKVGDLSKTLELVEQAENFTPQNNGTMIPQIKGDIDFRKLNFSLPGGKVKIYGNKDNQIIKKGDIVALVGRSGSGKSTIFSLLLKMIYVENKQILLSEYDLADIEVKYLREKIAYISQTNNLFNESIFENIAIGKKEPSNESQILEAARRAELIDLIENLPRRLDTIVGTSNSFLSGGQKQRICIARTFLNEENWEILLGDEITSALDYVTGSHILNSIIDFCRKENKTFIYSTHSIYTLEKCDRVMLINEQGAIEIDTPANMKVHNKYFQSLFTDKS